MEPIQQVVEQAVAVGFYIRASRERAAKRRGNTGLVGQAFDTDDTPFHVTLGRRLLQFCFAGHECDLTQGTGVGFAFSLIRAEHPT